MMMAQTTLTAKIRADGGLVRGRILKFSRRIFALLCRLALSGCDPRHSQEEHARDQQSDT
jgi:hypothetical protein